MEGEAVVVEAAVEGAVHYLVSVRKVSVSDGKL